MGGDPHNASDLKPAGRSPLQHALVAAWALLVLVLAGAVLWGHVTRAPAPGQEGGGIRLALAPAAAPAPEVPAAPAPAREPPAPAAAITPPAPSAPAELAPVPVPAPVAPARAPAPRPAPPAAAAPAPAPASAPADIPPPAWLRHGRPFDANDPRPRVTVVIGELGLSAAATEAAIQQLPGEVVLAFSPYADGLAHWIGLARAAGHEVLLNLPMEPANFPISDPGPRTLLTSLTPQQNLERLDWVLGRVDGYVGVTNQMGSRFTATPDALKPVLAALHLRGLVFLDSRATPRSVAARLASDIGLPRAIVDRQIDVEASRAAIDARLAEIERIARESGTAIALGQPYPVTLERVGAWVRELETRGLALAPLTAVINRQPDR